MANVEKENGKGGIGKKRREVVRGREREKSQTRLRDFKTT